jgi:capsular exopolysaccharide synthesis family protein
VQNKQIDVLSLLRDVLKNWWLVLVVGTAFALLANVWVTKNYVPEYTTETILVVSSTDLNSTVERNLSSTKNLAACFAEVLDSSVLRAKIAEDLGGYVGASTQVEQITETNMVEVKVTSSSQLQAFRVTNSMLANYSQITDYVLTDVITEVLQAPTIPTSPSNEPNMAESMAEGFVLGAVLVIAYLAVCSMLHDTVKNERQAEEKLDARFLGAVYHEKKKGSSFWNHKSKKADAMLLDNPLRSFRFAESNKMLAARVSSQMDREGKRVLMVTSVLENEGKSTVAANLALALAKENKRVLMVDLDLRKPAQYKILSLAANQRFDLAKAIQERVAPADMAVSYRQTRLSVIAGGVVTANTDALLGDPRLKELLDYWKDYVDYIVLDTAPLALTSDTEDMVQLADATVLVVREDFVLASAVNDAIDRLETAGGTVLGCVLNDAAKRAGTADNRYTL